MKLRNTCLLTVHLWWSLFIGIGSRAFKKESLDLVWGLRHAQWSGVDSNYTEKMILATQNNFKTGKDNFLP